MRKTNLLVLLIFALALGQILFGLTKVLLQTDLIDFRVYYEASQDFLKGINPYQPLYFQKIPFNYPPSAFIFLLPLVLFPLKVSQIIWLVLSFLFLFGFAWILFQLYIPRKEWWLKLLLTSFLLQNFPTKFTLVMGQANFLVLFLLITSFFFYLRQKSHLAGLFLGLATALKISPIFLIIFFLARKELKIVVSTLITFIAANLIFVFSSLEAAVDYFQTKLPELLWTTNLGYYYDQSLLAFLSRLGLEGPAWRLLNLFLLVGGVIFLLLKFQKTKSQTADLKFFSLLLLLITITNSFAWQHHLVFLFPAFLSASFYLIEKKEPLFGVILALAALLVGLHFRDPEHFLLTNPLIASHGLIGSFILGGLLLR